MNHQEAQKQAGAGWARGFFFPFSLFFADHILLPSALAGLLLSHLELDLGDGGKVKAVRQEEVLSEKGLVRRLSRLGNLLQWSQNGDRVEVRGLALGKIEDAAEKVATSRVHWTQREEAGLCVTNGLTSRNSLVCPGIIAAELTKVVSLTER